MSIRDSKGAVQLSAEVWIENSHLIVLHKCEAVGCDSIGDDHVIARIAVVDQEVVDGILQLLSVLLAQKEPYTQPTDDSYANPEITSWADEARDVLHYAIEGGLDEEYTVPRLAELGGYVSPRELCHDCGRRLTEEEIAYWEADGDPDRLCNPCSDPLTYNDDGSKRAVAT